MPVILRDTNVIKEEAKHVQAFRMVGEEVHDPPVLLDVRFRVRFKSVDHVWEFHSIADEEDREVVPNKIKITLVAEKDIISVKHIRSHGT